MRGGRERDGLGLGTFARLAAGVFLVGLVPAIALALLLTNHAASSLERAAGRGLEAAATTTAKRIDDWTVERRADFTVLADEIERDRGSRAARRLRIAARDDQAWVGFAIADPSGRILAYGGQRPPAGLATASFFRRARAGRTAFSDVDLSAGRPTWLAAHPRRDRSGRVDSILVGRVNPRVLSGFVRGVEFGRTGEALVREASLKIVGVAGRGTLQEIGDRTRTEASARAIAGRRGYLRYTDHRGVKVLGGYAPVPTLRWGVVVKQDSDEAFAAVNEQRELALLLLVPAALLCATFAYLVAARTTRPLLDLATAARRIAGGDLEARAEPQGSPEARELALSFNRMISSIEGLVKHLRSASTDVSASAVELSSASDELAATTTQQNAATTQTSTTMEELAATSASIAESMEAIAQQAEDTRKALAQADEELQATSTRTLELTNRIEQIGGILDLIDEIANRTSLLSLNAAIEAARAGEAGSGFAVVADEVRKLAERSKQSAGEIGEIVRAARAESNATVMAMEAGSKQMRHGLQQMDAVARGTKQTELTTQQQRAATGQVVDAMQSMSAASRQTTSTAQQIAAASTQLAELAGELERTAASALTDGDRPPPESPQPGPSAPAGVTAPAVPTPADGAALPVRAPERD